ncbi:ImmA/IrrE family metallo-endopeptidase [Nocardia mangyaensis]|uniref:ImmA/IrrE family metallo-endopeptidase n=1 Tax=Nocardia mangyaensis TaxID=2213200 RepID=UPI0026746D1A|nr:ImmA/IrrE family metallo-endopeptidase [Nocardia mangyaensis]MDO3645656.1 ImmA/IrrE family metallo-endopeptidase [Nocardia mangyaensis]
MPLAASPPTKSSTNDSSAPHVTLAKLRALSAVRPTTFEQSLRIARQQAALLLSTHRIDTGMVSIDIITELPHVRPEWIPGQRLPSAGFWDTATRQWVIQLAYPDGWTQQRCAIAREYKHILDYHCAAELYPGSTTVSSRHQAAQAADHFAAHLLVPDHLLRHAMDTGSSSVAELSAYFGVPKYMIRQHLSEIALDSPTSSRTRRDRSANSAATSGSAA